MKVDYQFICFITQHRIYPFCNLNEEKTGIQTTDCLKILDKVIIMHFNAQKKPRHTDYTLLDG